MRRYSVSIFLTVLLALAFAPNLQAQANETCATNAPYYERWANVAHSATMADFSPPKFGIAVSPNGEMLAVVTSTSTTIYDSQTLDLLSELERVSLEETPYEDYTVSWSPDSRRIAVAHSLVPPSEEPDPRNGVQIWNVQDQKLEYMLPFEPIIAVWSPDGVMIAVADDPTGMISVLDPNQHTLTPRTFTDISSAGFGLSAAWSPDSQLVAISSRTVPLILLDIGQSQLETIDLPQRDGGYLSWSPDGTYLALGSWVESSILIWNEAAHEVTRTLDDSTGNVFELQWSPDGKWLARGTQNGLYLWDMTSDNTEPVRAFDEHMPPFARVAWLPDSQHLISVDFEGSLYRWDIETGCVEAAVMNE